VWYHLAEFGARFVAAAALEATLYSKAATAFPRAVSQRLLLFWGTIVAASFVRSNTAAAVVLPLSRRGGEGVDDQRRRRGTCC